MNASKRRLRIMELLSRANAPLTGSTLAAVCHVTRQIIVGDIARLRAENTSIIATPQGYRLLKTTTGIKRLVVSKHGPDEAEHELRTIVAKGGTVCNVTIEHDVYGSLEGNLHLSTQKDIDRYLKRMKENHAAFLSSMSGGIHTHLIEAPTRAVMDEIIKALHKEGFIYT